MLTSFVMPPNLYQPNFLALQLFNSFQIYPSTSVSYHDSSIHWQYLMCVLVQVCKRIQHTSHCHNFQFSPSIPIHVNTTIHYSAYITLSQFSILTKHTYTYQHNNSLLSIHHIITRQWLFAAASENLAAVKLHARCSEGQTHCSREPLDRKSQQPELARCSEDQSRCTECSQSWPTEAQNPKHIPHQQLNTTWSFASL